MCNIKKLCTCDKVSKGQDYWKLEYFYGQFPSWGKVIETRPEHRAIAEKAAKSGDGIMGPLPMPQFKELFKGVADFTQMEKVVEAEVEWLNEGNPFDFEYEPFEGDRLMYVIGGQEIAFSYKKGSWKHYPHQAYSVDARRGVDARAEDIKARKLAKDYLNTNA